MRLSAVDRLVMAVVFALAGAIAPAAASDSQPVLILRTSLLPPSEMVGA